MIAIRKTDGGEIFDLPSDYVIEGEKNNPLFEQKGSQTVPISFPTTVKNNRLLKFPFRLDRTDRQEGTIGVIVEAGSVQQKGLLSVNAAGRKIISANIGFDESEIYAQFESMQLKNIPGLPVLDFGGSNTGEKLDSMLVHLTSVMKQQIETEYYVFPVILHHERVESEIEVVNADGSTTMEKTSKNYDEILNDVDMPAVIPPDYPNGAIAELKALSDRTIVRYENSEEIEFQVPKAYSVSPFLKVYRVLELIFANYGFRISENPFKEHQQLKKLVVLNNTVDAVLTGRLNYRDLMPDITIREFLDSLYAKFGMFYFIDSNSRTVSVRFLKDILSPENPDSVNLDRFKTGDLSIAFSPPKQLRLKMNREIEAAKVLYDTYEEFLEKFSCQFVELYLSDQITNDRGTQMFITERSVYGILNIFDEEAEMLISSEFFDWDKRTQGVEYEEIEMKDLCLPFLSSGSMELLLYDVGFKHLYSEIIVSGETQDNIVNPAKLGFAFGWGITETLSIGSYNYFFASQFNRDRSGNFMFDPISGEKYDISLSCNREDGLFNRFWKEYDAFLRHSNQEVTGSLHLSDLDIMNMKPEKKVVLENQPFLLKQVKYRLNQPGNISDCVLRTLRLYEPNNLPDEQLIVKYGRPKYYWKHSSVDDAPHPPGFLSKRIIESNFFTVNGVQVPKTYLSFLLPTEEQFAGQETRIYKYQTVYKIPLLNKPEVINTTVTYTPAEIIYAD